MPVVKRAGKTVVKHRPFYYVFTTFRGRDMPGFAVFCHFGTFFNGRKPTGSRETKRGKTRHKPVDTRIDADERHLKVRGVKQASR